jgi:hypothetical protein
MVWLTHTSQKTVIFKFHTAVFVHILATKLRWLLSALCVSCVMTNLTCFYRCGANWYFRCYEWSHSPARMYVLLHSQAGSRWQGNDWSTRTLTPRSHGAGFCHGGTTSGAMPFPGHCLAMGHPEPFIHY